jgi:hypothetical protein
MRSHPPPKGRLNPFVFVSETNMRFTLLLLASVAMALVLTLDLRLLLEIEEYLAPPHEAELPEIDLADTAWPATYMKALRTSIRGSLYRLFFPVAMGLAALGLATAIYWSYPSRIRRRNRLHRVPEDSPSTLVRQVRALSGLANVSPPSVEVQRGASFADGQVFGVRRRYSLRLGGRMHLLLRKAPDRFRAIVLHELGHIANRDVERTYVTQALWVAVVFSLLLPMVAVYSFRSLSGMVRELFGQGPDDFDWLRWYTTNLPIYLLWIVQVGLTLAVVAAIRSSVLRVREIYADWRAALWGVKGPLSGILAQAPREDRPGFLRRVYRLHPTARERLATLEDPSALFRIKLDIAVFAGVLLAFFLTGFFALSGDLMLLAMAVAIYVTLIPLRYLPQDSVWVLGAVTSGQLAGQIISVGLWLAFLLLGTYLMVGTVGIQVLRQSVVQLATGRANGKSYLYLLVPATLIAISLEIGFLIFPGGRLGPVGIYIANHTAPATIARHVLLMLLWIAAVAGVTWLWLIYVRFFSVRLPGTHAGTSAPRLPRYLLIATSSALLWILYLPPLVGQLQISDLMAGYDPSFPRVLPAASALALALYAVVFAATLILVQVHRRVVRPCCPDCGRVTKRRVAVGQVCEHCGADLAPWLYVARAATADTSALHTP